MDRAEFVNQVGEHCRLGDTEFLDTYTRNAFLFISVMSCNFSALMPALPLTLLSAIFLHYFSSGLFCIDSC